MLLRLSVVWFLAGLASAGQASTDQAASADSLAAQIQSAVAMGDFQGAMVVAHQIDEDRARFTEEANILHLAHSYRAALGRAHEAYDLGERSLLLLARGAQAAAWVRDKDSVDLFLGALDAQLARTSSGEVDVAAWRAFYDELAGHQEQLASEEAGLRMALARAHTVAWLVGGLMLLGFWLGRPKARATEA